MAPVKRSRLPRWIGRLIARWQLRNWHYTGVVEDDPYENDGEGDG
jgi:hypothetical protein